jgi:hypothetical protein
MYMFDPNHHTELFRERQEMLAQEARDAHLASMLRAARRNRTIGQERTTWSPGRAIALWGRTSVPYFRA